MISWGLIGAGDVVERKSGPAFQNIEGSECVALMRRNQAEAERVSRSLHVPRVYSVLDDLLADSSINAVYIATPPSSHAEFAIRSLSAGKDVYLEKPVAMNTAEAMEISRAWKKSGRKLSVAYYRRALPAFEKVKNLLADSAVGDVRFIRIRVLQPAGSRLIAQTKENWRLIPSVSGGGLFHDLAPHQLDLMLLWFGIPRSVQGRALNLSGDSAADDYVSGDIQFESGPVLSGVWNFCIDSSNRAEDLCEIFGSEGCLSFSFFGETREKNFSQELPPRNGIFW